MKKQLLLVAAILVSAATTFAQNVPSYVSTNGLVGWWPFNGNANDESGNGNNGTVNGATLTTDRNGNGNKAYSFDGKSNYIQCLSNITNIDVISISGWAKNNSIMGGQFVHVGQDDNNSCTGFGVGKGGNSSQVGLNFWNIYEGNNLMTLLSCVNYYNSNYTLPSTSWFHYAVIKTTSKISYYLNGLLVGSSAINKSNNPINKIFFGSSGLSGSSKTQYNGSLDDVAIFNRALTQQEITNLYLGCKDETATTSSLSGILLTNSNAVNLNANPSGGSFSGAAVTNGQFVPVKAHLGKNSIKYNFTNSTGCKDSTDFSVIVYDTLGNVCSTYDTLKIKVKITAGVYSNQSNVVKIYPNPTNTDLVIDNGNYTMLAGYKVSIFNSVGAKVYEGAINSSETTIPLSSLGNKGIYIVRILDSNSQTVESKTIVLE